MKKTAILLKLTVLTVLFCTNIFVASAATTNAATEHLKELQSWLNTNNSGIDYINRNLGKATEAAKKWNVDQQVQMVAFDFSSASNFKCQFTFSIRTNGEKIAVSPCPTNTLTLPEQAELKEQKNYQPISGISTSPKIKLRNFVDLMLQDPVLQSELNSILGSQGSITSNYKLYVLSSNIVIWEATLKNSSTGKSAMIQARANSDHPLFYLKKL